MHNKTTPVTHIIEEIIEKVPGWTPPDQLLALYTLALSLDDTTGDILEIGSWCGRSTVVLGLAAKECRNTKVQCIDLFPAKDDWKQNPDGSWSFQTENVDAYTEQTVWDEPFHRDIAPLYEKHDSILEIFLHSLKLFGVEKFINWHKGNVVSFGKYAGGGYKMAFIDGDHGEEACRQDIEFALRHMPGKGWLCFDDAFSTYDGVNEAIVKYAWTHERMVMAQQLTRKFHTVFIRPK